MCNCKIRTKSLALCRFRIREVISAKISTLMSTTLLNNHTKFHAKIFKPYRVITFLVLGHFFSRTLYTSRHHSPMTIVLHLAEIKK